jgi:hypothetical protein
MVRSVAKKVLWVGRATVFLMGLALMLALVFGIASTALGANGGNFILGSLNNTATAITKLTGTVGGGPALQVSNPSTATGSTALDLQVATGKAPMKVNRTTKVSNLNADKLDGKDFAAFDAQEVIDQFGPLPREGTYTSKGGTLIISASGSGFRSVAFARIAGDIGMRLLVDGVPRDFIDFAVTQRDIRHSFVADHVVVEGLPAGTHTIRLEALYDSITCNTASESRLNFCTTTNGDDRYNVTVVEIPN